MKRTQINRIVDEEVKRMASHNPAADYTSKKYIESYNSAQQLLKDIASKLETHRKRQQQEPEDWGFVGSMNHVNELLGEVSRFIRIL